MRQDRRVAAPARAPRAPSEPLASGYGLVVDGRLKTEFTTKVSAIKAGRELKQRFPMLQIKIYDAAEKRSEVIELATA